jgi:hypothetical protein
MSNGAIGDDIYVTTVTGDLTINQPINAGAGDVILRVNDPAGADVLINAATVVITGTLVDIGSTGDIIEVGKVGKIAAANLILQAAGNIDLQSVLNSIDTVAAVSTTGTIKIVNSKALILGTVITKDGLTTIIGVTASGSALVHVLAGNLTFDVGAAITSTTAGITLTIDNGSIIALGAGPHMVAAGDSVINLAGGTITTSGTPLDVNITGVLTLNISNASAGTCAILTGTVTGIGGPLVTGAGWPLLINTSTIPLAPNGYVYFNGTIIWPPSSFFNYLLLIEELSRGRENAIYEIMQHFIDVTNANPRVPFFYFYHPLTPTDLAAFDNIALDVNAYNFIDDNLDLKKRPAAFYGA